APLTSAATMATAAIVPPPNVSVAGGDFTLDGVPPFSLFYLLAGSRPAYRLTYNAPTAVTDHNVAGVNAYVVADAYMVKLRTAFAVNAQAGTATVFVRAEDAAGSATTGVSGSAALVVAGTGVRGPFYLDAKMAPAPQATSTSASGWLAYFNVPAGTIKIGAGAGYTVQAADTPDAGDAVSLVSAVVAKATTAPPPSNVSFQTSVLPIFITRGCYNCHSGNGQGRRLGDLVLDGSAMKIYAALTSDLSPTYNTTRVNLKDPPKSLVLTMPSLETPPDPHPTVVFTSSADVDYQKILVWIKESAKFN